MTSIREVLNAAERTLGRLALSVPEDWHQGRTAYGGFTTALAYEAARSVADDLPPLRSVQIAFVGPVQGSIEVRAELLRRGRSTAFVEAKIYVEGAVALTALFVFAIERESAVVLDAPPAADVIQLKEAEPRGQFAALSFIAQFEFRFAKPLERGVPDILQWVRLRDPSGVDPVTALLLIADALPPGAMPLLKSFAPVSSVTWHMNFLTSAPQTQDGWWLLQAKADQAAHGLSSQSMAIWSADGTAIARGIQCMAIFG